MKVFDCDDCKGEGCFICEPDNIYPNRDPASLEPEYSRHIKKMTEMELHSKSEIAVQLALRDRAMRMWRDMFFELSRLRKRVEFEALAARMGPPATSLLAGSPDTSPLSDDEWKDITDATCSPDSTDGRGQDK